MKTRHIILPLLMLCTAVAAQDNIKAHQHGEDSTDVFFRHLNLNEVTVTGVTGDTKLKHATAPVSIVTPQILKATASTNIIDAIAHQPGVSQLTTGGSISKPIIRGLGYNRVVVMSEGVRQEGQQWGDEHGVEVDGSSVGSVEILKGPASLMYGSDAMAGVVILHPQPTLPQGEMLANVSTEYQTNNGLFAYNLSMAGNQKGFVWNARYSDKMAHAYKNKYDGYVPGSQFRERAGRLMLGLNKAWGHSRLTGTIYHLTPGIIEGERDPETGELEHEEGFTGHSYGKQLPFQQVKHYKLVWDNSLNLPTGYLKAIIGYQQNRRQEFEESENDYELYFKLHTLTYDLRYVTNEWEGWKLSTGIGGMYQKSGNEGEEYLIPDYRLFDFGIYATATKALGERWTLSGGVRYDHRRLHGDELIEDDALRFQDFSRHFNGLTGSIGAVCNINEHFNLRLNLARGFRTPNMSELASNGVHEGSIRYELGNQQLKAESVGTAGALCQSHRQLNLHASHTWRDRGGLPDVCLYAGGCATAGLRSWYRPTPRALAALLKHLLVCRCTTHRSRRTTHLGEQIPPLHPCPTLVIGTEMGAIPPLAHDVGPSPLSECRPPLAVQQPLYRCRTRLLSETDAYPQR